MPNYRRVWHRGGTYFFTDNLLEWHGDDLLLRRMDAWREAVRVTKQNHPFIIYGWVVLPDHLHCVIELLPDDGGFAQRLRLIKRRGERGVWQWCYWEHLIRDEEDFAAHMDYVHINPLKHDLVERVVDWLCSTFHRGVQAGI